MEKADVKDCIVVGGGPAGLTAALYIARFQRSVTLFDAADGRAVMIPKTHNIGPFPGGISGRELVDRMRSHAELYGAVLETATVSAVEKRGELFCVTTERKVEMARTVVFACGVFNHRPPLPVAEHNRGLSLGLIRYCPVCDGYEVRGKRIAVFGSGDNAFAEARFISTYSPSVTLIPSDGSVGVGRDGIAVLAQAMTGMALSDSQVIVTLQNGETACFDTLYVALGTRARSDLAAGAGVRIAEAGCILVDAKQKTDIDGAYAVGDITDGLDQIAVAMGQGAVAATAIHNDLSLAKR